MTIRQKTRPRKPSPSRRRASKGAKGAAVCEWIESTCQHTIGRWAGLKFKLAPWQRDFVESVFGNVDRYGRRQTRIAYLQIARKQGKSELAAAIALYMLIADHEAQPQVYLAAFDREQAGIVYKVAADMVERSPNLRGYAKVYRGTKRIVCVKGPSSGGFLQAIACDAAGSHGFNASAVVLDELHTQRDSSLVDVLETSMSAREQPLMLAISTAGHDRNSICFRWYEKARQVLSGTIRDKSFVGRIYELPEGTSFEEVAERGPGGRFLREDDLWPLANPSLKSQPGGFIRPDEIKRQILDAVHFPAAQNKVMNLHFNVWTQSESRWFSLGMWDACGGLIDEAKLKGKVCFGGIDLGSTSDFTAFAMVFPRDGETGDGYDVVMRCWLPEAAIEKRSQMKDQLDAWIRAGFIKVTPGDVLDYRAVKQEVIECAAQFDMRACGYDPWQATQIAVELNEELGEDFMVPVRQGFRTLSAPSKLLETLVGRGLDGLNHGGNPVLRWHADNVVAEVNADGAVKPSKKKSSEKIDMVAALVTALERAMNREDAAEVEFVAFND